MTDEPMVEVIGLDELDGLERVFGEPGWSTRVFASHRALLSQLREQRERAKTAESERDAARGWTRVVAADWRAEWEAAQAEVDRHVELLRELMERTLAAEHTVREQRKAWDELVERLAEARTTLNTMAGDSQDVTNETRLRHKAEGVGLAMSYVKDYRKALAALAPDTEGEGT